jgi:hypothetical protein
MGHEFPPATLDPDAVTVIDDPRESSQQRERVAARQA